MKRVEILAKHRQASEAAVLQMNRKHVLGLQAEIQRIDREQAMKEKYLVFEKSLVYAKLDKIQQRQISLGLIKSPLSRATPRSVQRRLQTRRLLRMMHRRPAPEIFLTSGDTETKPLKGIILPPVPQQKCKGVVEQTALNSSKYAPSWLDLPDAESARRKASCRLVAKIKGKPESPPKKTLPGKSLPPIDVVQLVNIPVIVTEVDGGDGADADAMKQINKAMQSSGDGTINEENVDVGGEAQNSATQEESVGEFQDGIEEMVDADGNVQDENHMNDGESEKAAAAMYTADGVEEQEKDINNTLRKLSIQVESDRTNRSRSLDQGVAVPTSKPLRPQSAPGPRNEES